MLNKKLTAIIKKILVNAELTSDEKRIYIDYSICKNHTGKMLGMQSISTSPLENPYCQARKEKENCICAYCYAESMIHKYTTLSNKLKVNTLFYSRYRIEKNDVPLINCCYFRFEAFGDLQNVLQLENYYTIAKANNQTVKRFGLWTKNYNFTNQTKIKKPRNMTIVYSEPILNKLWTISEFELFQKYNPAVDHVFIVCTKDYIKQNNVVVTCGARSCIKCHKCYYCKKQNRIIVEQKK